MDSDKRDSRSSAIFDDWNRNDEIRGNFRTKYWTQVCEDCRQQQGLPDEFIEKGSGQGICGVRRCENESDHYYDFDSTELK